MKTEEEIIKRIKELEENARSYPSKNRSWHRRDIRSLLWVLEKK